MSDTQTVPVSGKPTLTLNEAANALAQSRVDPVKEAASTLGKRASEARKERQAQAQEEVEQELPEDETPEPNDNLEASEDQSDLTDEGAEPEPDIEAAEDDADEDSDDSEQPLTITIDGEVMTADEVRSGVLRQADYTKKTMELSEERKALQAERSQRLPKLDNLITALSSMLPRKPTAKLAREDYAAYVEQSAVYEEVSGMLQEAIQQRDTAISKTRAERRQQAAQELASTYWTQPGELEKGVEAVETYLKKEGVPPELIGEVEDATLVRIADKARKYDELMAKKPSIQKRVVDKPKVKRPGAKTSKGAQVASRVNEAKSQLNKSGSFADGLALLRAQRAANRGRA